MVYFWKCIHFINTLLQFVWFRSILFLKTEKKVWFWLFYFGFNWTNCLNTPRKNNKLVLLKCKYLEISRTKRVGRLFLKYVSPHSSSQSPWPFQLLLSFSPNPLLLNPVSVNDGFGRGGSSATYAIKFSSLFQEIPSNLYKDEYIPG